MRQNRNREKGKKPIKKRPDGYTGERKKKLKERAKKINKGVKKWKKKQKTPQKSFCRESSIYKNSEILILQPLETTKKDH